jgi:hypothetical protein
MSPKADDKELVQVLFEATDFQMIEKLAAAEGVKVAHWVREAARMRLGGVVIDADAWDASSAATEDARQTRESAPHGSYRLRCLTPPMGSKMAVEVQWVRNGRQGLTRPLLQRMLLHDGLSPFDKFQKGEPAYLYLRGAGYWQVLAVLGRDDGVAVVELQRVGFSSNDVKAAEVSDPGAPAERKKARSVAGYEPDLFEIEKIGPRRYRYVCKDCRWNYEASTHAEVAPHPCCPP